MRFLHRLMRSTRAATAVEYGLIAALIFLAATAAITNVATSTTKMWMQVSTESTEAMDGEEE